MDDRPKIAVLNCVRVKKSSCSIIVCIHSSDTDMTDGNQIFVNTDYLRYTEASLLYSLALDVVTTKGKVLKPYLFYFYLVLPYRNVMPLCR